MAYYLTRFRDTVLPLTQPVTEMPTAAAINGTMATLGGGFDAWGSADAPANFPIMLQYRCIVTAATPAAYVAAVDALRALARTQGYLYRTGQDGGIQRAAARLERESALDSVETSQVIEYTFDFAVWEQWSDNWVRATGMYWDATTKSPPLTQLYFDTGLFWDAAALTTTLTTGSDTASVANGGNVAVEDAIITITAKGSNITAVTLTLAAQYVKWTWTGTLVADKSLVIDCGALTVLNDGSNAYSGLALDATHAIQPWLRLAPGANSVVVARTGGDATCTINFDFADRWA